MRNKNKETDINNTSGSRQRPALVLLLVMLIAAAFFIMSGAAPVKTARDALFGKLGIVTAEQNKEDDGSSETASADDLTEGADPSEALQKDTGSSDSGSETEAADLSSGEYAGSLANIDAVDPDSLPVFSGQHYVTINGNIPVFPDVVYEKASLTEENGKLKTEGSLPATVDRNKLTPYEKYGGLDNLGRCTYAYGCLGPETMPQEGEERGDISSVHPSGWAKAQNWERSHLIAWALSAENANEQNLITGTHYLNYDGMRPVEEFVEHYIWNTGNHVLYMSVPWYSGDELIPRGVQMTARSVEDNGKGVSFSLYCFNVTPGASIDYRTGIVTTEEQAAQPARQYVINRRSGVFHYPDCEGAAEMSAHNREEVTATRTELTKKGYTPCGLCKP